MNHILIANHFGKKHRDTKRQAKEMFVLMILAFVFTVLFVFGQMVYESKIYAETLPTEREILEKVTKRTENSHIYDRDGRLLYTFKDPNSDSEYVEIDDIPMSLKWSLIAAEDENFYRHNGVDYTAILRSTMAIVSSRGETVMGGSTITQQLVKNSVLTNERTLDRKLKEMLISFFVEQEYDKDFILELYLNSAPFGGRVRGVKTAAKTYFGKDLEELTLEESVFLVSLVQQPGQSSPLFAVDEQKAWDMANSRSQYIFGQLEENHDYIKSIDPDFYSLEEVNTAKNTAVVLKPEQGNIEAPHFVFYIKDILAKEPYNISEDELYAGGFEIHTSLDLEIQNLAQTKLRDGVNRYRGYGMRNGGLISIDPANGDLVAMVGSIDYWGERSADGRFDPQMNVTTSLQNAGSTLKPFVAYEAFRQGIYAPGSIIKDEPVNFWGYRPKNYDGKFMGEMTVATALVESRNTPFVKMLNAEGVDNLLDVLDRLEYKGAKQRDRYGLALSLGGFDITLLEHTRAYGALATGGNLVTLRPVHRILKSDGEVVFEAEIENNLVLDSQAAKMVNRILDRNGPYGVAGKTGTTDRNSDTYFMGYSDRMVTGIWVGNNNNARMSGTAFGSNTSKPIWLGYYYALIKDHPEYKGKVVVQ